MNFRVDRWSAAALRRSGVAVAMVGLSLLASCGGSGVSGQSRQFEPTRIIVFGDETSLLLPSTAGTADGRKYTVNGFNPFTTVPNTVIDCRANPLWVQSLATEFDLVFAECNPDNLPVSGQMRASVGAQVADVVSAIDTFLLTSSFVPDDLVTVLVGTYDIIELYERVRDGLVTEDAAVAAAEDRGELLARQFDRITDNPGNSRGRALYVTVPDVGTTPFGIGELSGRAERVRVLGRLSQAFNDSLRAQIANNGRSLGSLNLYQFFRNIEDFDVGNSNSGFSNTTEAACTEANVLDCTTLTLQTVPGQSASQIQLTWFWASGFYLGAGAHLFLGDEAIDLATNLPF